MFALTEKGDKQRTSSGINSEVHRPDLTLENDNASESFRENVCGSVPWGVSSGISRAASEGEAGRGPACGLEFSRPGSEAYLTASDDSSSLFDDDMQRAERPSFNLLGSSDATLGECKQAEEEEDRAKLEDCSSEDLNKRFQSQRLDSSSSSSEPNTPSPILTPAITPKRPKPPQDPKDNPASPKQPRLRTPGGFGLVNVSLANKHLSQPPVSSEAAHGQTRNALSMLRPLRPQETDLDQEQDVFPSPKATSTVPSWEPSPGTDETPEMLCDSSGPGSKPPTPPLHRLPSWVRLSNFHLIER